MHIYARAASIDKTRAKVFAINDDAFILTMLFAHLRTTARRETQSAGRTTRLIRVYQQTLPISRRPYRVEAVAWL